MEWPTQEMVFTVDAANRTLPLVRVIVRDIMKAHLNLCSVGSERTAYRVNRIRERRKHLLLTNADSMFEDANEPNEEVYDEHRQRLSQLAEELNQLGILLQSQVKGVVGFPSVLENRRVFLCWEYDEPEVAFWHEINQHFGRRRPIHGASRNSLLTEPLGRME